MASMPRSPGETTILEKNRKRKLIGAAHLGIFFVLSAATLIFVKLQYDGILHGTELLLQSIASQQARGVEEWRRRHLVEAEETRGDRALRESARAVLSGGDARAASALRLRFENFHTSYGYAASLLTDADLNVVLNDRHAADSLPLAAAAGPVFSLAVKENRPVLSDLLRLRPTGAPSLLLAIPLSSNSEGTAPRASAEGFLVHIIEAESELFPTVDSLPFPDRFVGVSLFSLQDGRLSLLRAPESSNAGQEPGLLRSGDGSLLESKAAQVPTGLIRGPNRLGVFSYAIAVPVKDSPWILMAETSRSKVMGNWYPVFIAIGLIPFVGTLALALLGTNRLLKLTSSRYQELLDAERRLRKAESQFSAFMDRMPSMVMIKDEESRIIFANPSMRAHYPVESWLGKMPREIFGEPQASTTLEWDKAALEKGYVEYEEARTDKNGQVLNLLTQKFAIDVGDGRRFIGQIITDVTERDRSNRQMRQLNASLESQVRQQSAQMESSNEDFQRFVYALTHGISSPLSSLLDYAEGLERACLETLDEESRRKLIGLRQSADNLTATMEDLFEIFRLSTIELQIKRENVGLIAESILSDRIKAEPGRVLSISTSPSMYAECDARLVAKLYTNLIDSALESTRSMPVTKIEIGCGQPNAEGGPAVFFMRDNGVGFDMTNADLIFKPFLRMEEEAGVYIAGKGLAMAKRAVERHGGKIWFESKPGAGTAVFFTLSP